MFISFLHSILNFFLYRHCNGGDRLERIMKDVKSNTLAFDPAANQYVLDDDGFERTIFGNLLIFILSCETENYFLIDIEEELGSRTRDFDGMPIANKVEFIDNHKLWFNV